MRILHSITIKSLFARILGSITSHCSWKWARTHHQRPDPGDGGNRAYADPCCRFVIKEFAHTFSCAYIEFWMHLKSLESSQEARVALGCSSSYSYAFFVLSKLPACIHNSIYASEDVQDCSVEWRQRLGIRHCWHQKNNRWLSKDISGRHKLILSYILRFAAYSFAVLCSLNFKIHAL